MSRDSDTEAEEAGVPLVAATGLPHVPEEVKGKACFSGTMMITIFTIVPRAITFGIAYGIYRLNQATYDGRIAIVNALGTSSTSRAKLELGYLYIAAGCFSVLVQLLNAIPAMVWKAKVLPGNAGNLRSNMLIYKVNQVDSAQRLPYVVLEEDDEIGVYNRGNRALHHFVENGLGLVVNIVLAGLVFSEPILVLVVLYALARVWYQVAYATGGYGLGCCKHAIPFALHSVIIATTIELLVWLAGVRLLQS